MDPTEALRLLVPAVCLVVAIAYATIAARIIEGE